MMRQLDKWLDGVTMYRLVEYILIAWLGLAAILGFAGLLPYSGFAVIISAVGLVFGCWIVNLIFAWAFKAPQHDHSAIITGLILALIISPIQSSGDIWFYFWAPTLAMAGKYIIAWRSQHVFNPAAFAVAVTAIAIGASANWWVGTVWMLPFLLVGGFLIVKKIRRIETAALFLMAAVLSVTVTTLLAHKGLVASWKFLLIDTPLFFFATVMLTEPWTMPPTQRLRRLYAVVVGLLFAPLIHIGSVYSTPELALVAGNLIFWVIVRRERYVLKVEQKTKYGTSVIDFGLRPNRPIPVRPGQYLEWTVPHTKADNRGIRRYFTLASSPTEDLVHLGVKFYEPASSFKSALKQLHPGMTIVAGQIDGDFTLPTDTQKKIVCLAGGIGVTPFRSMAQYMVDTKEHRSVTMFYAVQDPAEIAYDDLFASAGAFGWETIYVIGDESKASAGWTGERGRVTAEMIQRYVSDYTERYYYISGPQVMVGAMKQMLRGMDLPSRHIKTDYFPGFA